MVDYGVPQVLFHFVFLSLPWTHCFSSGLVSWEADSEVEVKIHCILSVWTSTMQGTMVEQKDMLSCNIIPGEPQMTLREP